MKKTIFTLSILSIIAISGTVSARNGFGSLDNTYQPNFYQPPTSFYNNYGTYQGQAQPDGKGGYSIYNEYGSYQGKVTPNKNSWGDKTGGYDYYNKLGRRTGYSR